MTPWRPMSKRCSFERLEGSLIESESAMLFSCSDIVLSTLSLVDIWYVRRGIFFNRGHHETPFWALQVQNWTNSLQVGLQLKWSSMILMDMKYYRYCTKTLISRAAIASQAAVRIILLSDLPVNGLVARFPNDYYFWIRIYTNNTSFWKSINISV